MASNPLLAALMRLQPTANRMDFPEGGGFDDDLAQDSFLSSAQPVDPLGALRGGRKAELTERIFNEKRAPNRFMPGQLDALNFLMRDIESQEAEDPLQMEIGANQRARLSGFPSAAQAGEYGREFETAKMQLPLVQTQTTAQGAIRQKELEGQRYRDVEALKNRGALDKQREIESTKLQGFDRLGQFMGAGGQDDGRSRSGSVPGLAFSVGAERPDAVTPSALQTNLMNARRLFARDPNNASNKAALDQAIANLVNSSPASDTSKQWAHAIATNPRLSAMPLKDIIELHERKTGDVLEPEEITELSNLMKQVLAGMNDPRQQ